PSPPARARPRFPAAATAARPCARGRRRSRSSLQRMLEVAGREGPARKAGVQIPAVAIPSLGSEGFRTQELDLRAAFLAAPAEAENGAGFVPELEQLAAKAAEERVG